MTETQTPKTDAPPSSWYSRLRFAEFKAVRLSAERFNLVLIRRVTVTIWALTIVALLATRTMSFGRSYVLVAVAVGLAAASIGRRNVLSVIRDWLPFGVLLAVYDSTRGIAAFLGMPTQWHLAVDADRWMFHVVPTVWLQEHLKMAEAQWWEVFTSFVYMSYFVVPYAVAGFLWLRDRVQWRRFTVRLIAIFFLGLIGYVMVPAAPPWAAAKCTSSEVADGSAFPPCITTPERVVPDNLLGPVVPEHDGAPYIERISSRGWDVLHIGPVRDVIEVGQDKSNQVAAIPSLHAGVTALLAMFMWGRTKALGRTIFTGYALVMAFTLVYSAEHYVIDLILGWGLAALVMVICNYGEKAWYRRKGRGPEDSDSAAGIKPATTTISRRDQATLEGVHVDPVAGAEAARDR
jgi:PAP2 superfamily